MVMNSLFRSYPREVISRLGRLLARSSSCPGDRELRTSFVLPRSRTFLVQTLSRFFFGAETYVNLRTDSRNASILFTALDLCKMEPKQRNFRLRRRLQRNLRRALRTRIQRGAAPPRDGGGVGSLRSPYFGRQVGKRQLTCRKKSAFAD